MFDEKGEGAVAKEGVPQPRVKGAAGFSPRRVDFNSETPFPPWVACLVAPSLLPGDSLPSLRISLSANP